MVSITGVSGGAVSEGDGVSNELERMEQLEAAAAKGPWTVQEITDDYAEDDDPASGVVSRGMAGPNGGLNHGEDMELFDKEDATFITEARTFVPWAIAEIKRLRETA